LNLKGKYGKSILRGDKIDKQKEKTKLLPHGFEVIQTTLRKERIGDRHIKNIAIRHEYIHILLWRHN